MLGWIPWYTETDEQGQPLLDPRQRGAVEAHASECADCRAELDMIAGAPYRIDFEIPDPDRVFDEITARIDAGEAQSADLSPTSPTTDTPFSEKTTSEKTTSETEPRLSAAALERVEDWLFDEDENALSSGSDAGRREGARVIRGPWSSPAIRVAAAAAVFVIGLFAGSTLDAFRPFSGANDAVYQSAAATSGATAGPMIDVVFVEGRTMDEVARELRTVGGEIVSGPSSVGRYRVRIGGDVTEAADLAAITARLKAGAEPIAIFAEPALP